MCKANDSKKELINSDKGFWFDQLPKDNYYNSISVYFRQKFKAVGHEY